MTMNDLARDPRQIGTLVRRARKRQGLSQAALGDKAGIRRYGHFTLPMEETLVTVAVDLSGRYALAFNAPLPSPKQNGVPGGRAESEKVEGCISR